MHRIARLIVLALAPLAACAVPPPSAYVRALGGSRPPAQLSLGDNSVHEACTQSPSEDGGGADVYCGTWQQPSARVRAGGPASQSQLAQLATTSTWRAGIDERFTCAPPTRTSILGGEPAELLQCTQRVGGWPHVAMVALVNGHAWYADGVLPAATVMERSIGVQSGLVHAGTVMPNSEADAVLAQRLAAQAFRSGDIGQFNELMAAGTRANLADNPAAAEAAFRAALAVQQKALGRNNPNTSTALMTLALQLSDNGLLAESNNLFTQAARLAPNAADPIVVPRLAHYRALDALNRGQTELALSLLRQADAGYTTLVPAGVLHARAPLRQKVGEFSPAARIGADLVPDQDMLADPSARAALLGLIETRRYEALVLRLLGQANESEAILASANQLAQSSGLARPIVQARLYRTAGVAAAAAGDPSLALSDLSQSTAAFSRALPDSKPLAETYLLRAGQLVQQGDIGAALPICRNAANALVTLKAGVVPLLMSPCLDAFAAAAGKSPAQNQGLLGEMFVAAQLAQAGITSQQIAQASARLQENARDPKVAAAIKNRQDANANLQSLYRQRDELAAAQSGGLSNGSPPAPGVTADFDKQINAAQSALASADAALQAAAPNYGQLVQQVVPASAVLAALHPHEAFVSIVLGNKNGWAFLLRDNTIAISKVDGGTARMAKLVQDLRASIELTASGLPSFNIAAARELYDSTLGGFGATALDGETALVVAPSGPLLSIPFEVLLTGPAQPDNLAGAPWLVRKFAIAHVPAPTNFVSLRKIAENSRATRPWFGFGDFVPVTPAQARAVFPGPACAESAQLFAELPALPFAAKELDVARQILGASPSEELLGRAFTAPAVLKTPLKNYRILHFATHALLPSELRCQSEPAIVTSVPPGAADASGALLTASDVVGMDLDANLVILSACNSGGPGGTTAGESLSGLARAFFFAGARGLMVTHWDVSDKVAAYLVADTLGRIKDNPGIGVAAALRDSQLSLLQTAAQGQADLAHPFFWAPFAIIGEGGANVPPARMAAR